jgi:hypothetical protein
MPRFYFDIDDGAGTSPDEVGLDLPDLDHAIHEARRALMDMGREQVSAHASLPLQIIVRPSGDAPVQLVLRIAMRRLGRW